MKYLKKYLKYLKESSATTAPETKPGQPITKPEQPTKPIPPPQPKRKEDEEKIDQPLIDPGRKAVTEMDVVNRFIEEMHKKGESIEKYM
jgi:hypothetical protein